MPCFKFQVSRMSGSQSKTPLSTISRLDLWVTDGSWYMFCIYILSWYWCDANFGSLERTWTEPKPKRDFPHTTIFDLSTLVSWDHRGWKNPWVRVYHDSSKFQKLIRYFVKLLTWNWTIAVQHYLGRDPIWNLIGRVKNK